MFDKSIYFDDAKDFRNNETGEYWPMSIHMSSQMFQPLKSDYSSDIFEMFEVRLSLSKIIFDDAWFQFGLSRKTKELVNFERLRPIYEQKAYMSYNGSHPLA